jgi:hypothetical protein
LTGKTNQKVLSAYLLSFTFFFPLFLPIMKMTFYYSPSIKTFVEIQGLCLWMTISLKYLYLVKEITAWGQIIGNLDDEIKVFKLLVDSGKGV